MQDKLGQRVKQLIDSEEWKELEDLILNTEDEWVLEILGRRIHSTEGAQWVGGILSALSCDTRESTALRLKVYDNVLKQVRNESSGNDKTAGELIGVLMVHVDTFPTNAIVSLISEYVEYIESGAPLQGRWVDLLAKLITSVSQKEEVSIGGKQMAGDDYRYQVLKTLCDLSWSAETTTSLLPVFKDMELPKEELQDVIFKVERVLKVVDYQSVPPIIYHLILLVRSKLPGRVLQVIIDYFNTQEHKLSRKENKRNDEINSMDADSEAIEDSKYSDLTEAKGTVILHVTHHAQYNPALVRDYLKFIKSSTWLPERVITPFNLALSLSLASIEKYQDQILESLKSCLLKSFRQEERSLQSQWLRETWGEDCDVTAAFRTTVDNCIMGWDQVSQGLVHLAFSLLESGSGPKGETYVSQQAVELASIVLPLIVRKQPHLARSVISQLSNLILSASSPIQYIEILGKLAKSLPLVLLDHLNVIREPLEYSEFLSIGAATHFLHALLPLLKMSMTLKDTLMITLRKMLFSKKVESRQIAVKGFLQFLRHFRVMGALPSSQASMSFSSSMSTVSINADVHSIFNSSTNEALCLELLGVLRRCFSQQHEVKSTLYLGLYDVSRTNPKLVVNILELLIQHSKCFLDLRADIFNPIILKKAIVVQGETVKLIEPMADLLSSLAACKNYYEEHRANDTSENDDDDNAITVLNEICSMFDILTEKLSGSGLEDLGIDANGDFSTSSSCGQKNILSAKVMIGVFDSLIEHAFTSTSQTTHQKMQTVLSLFKSQRKVVDLLKEKSGKPGKKDGSKSKGRTPTKPSVSIKSHLSLRATADMLVASLNDTNTDDSESSNILKDNHELQLYLLSVVEEVLSSIKGMTQSDRDKILPQLRTVAKVLLHECKNNIGTADSSDDRQVLRLRQCLLILASIFTIFNKFYKPKLESILKEMMGKNDNNSVDSLLYKITKRLQKMLLKILHHDERDPLLKDATTIVHIMTTVTQAMDPKCPEIIEIQDWILQLCKDQDFGHCGLAESMMNLLIRLSNQIKSNHNLTRGIARELHHKLGDFEQGVEIEESDKYKMVTEETSSAILINLLVHLDDTLGLVELVLNKMKASVVSGTDYDVGKIEKNISIKCSSVIVSLHEIIQSALPLGASTDQTLRIVTKLYNVLSHYVKYYLDLYRLKNYTQISDKFEKVVYMSGDMISGPVYPMITYIEGVQRQAGTKNQGTLTARAIKESKLIPSLIFAIEQYEKHLITLSRKSKVNLMQAMKMSTARDFRIMPAALLEVLQKDNEEEEELSAGDEDIPEEEETGHDEQSSEHGEDEDNNRHKKEEPSPVNKKIKGQKRQSERENENGSNSQNQINEPPSKQRKKSLGRKKK
ncbi:Fanconi anemia group I protein [Procambarus clarkii]|uniref:Fanconi anemia group I protein n=1 Tax=Procambarus clarkii TaxID=6728 RepID=UPI003742A797